MSDLSDVIHILPTMKSGNELLSALEVLPEYDTAICDADAPVRLMALSDLYRVYVPNQMSLEIYSKLYLALMRSLQKKGTTLAIQQRNQNYRAIVQQEYSGIMGGSDSFTIIGASGIGKSSAISRAITLVIENRIFEVENPYTQIILCICVQCPFDSSVKGLLLEILRKVNEVIGGGISICMVGTPESAVFFEQAMQLARRSLGLRYDVMEYGEDFKTFCEVLYSYQYVKRKTEITDAVTAWLYEHTSGNISVVVSLIHDAQEIAILNGREILNLESLNEAYQQRLSMLHGFIQPRQKCQTSKTKRRTTVAKSNGSVEPDKGFTIAGLVSQAKSEGLDIVELLKNHIPVVEVAV